MGVKEQIAKLDAAKLEAERKAREEQQAAALALQQQQVCVCVALRRLISFGSELYLKERERERGIERAGIGQAE